MRIRQLLLSSVMCGGVVLMSSASWSQSAPKVTYKPQGEWAVTRMAAKGPGKAPYCTMARRFGDNVILTFARNAGDETSVAMDFPPKTLAKGQSYYVTLDAGANEKRAFDVTPVSDKAMVIRLGHDAKFHSALSRSGVLNVDIAGLQYEFAVPDMAKGDQDLNGCVGSIVEPAAGEGAKPVQVAQADTMKAARSEDVKTEDVKTEAAPIVRRATDDILAAPITNKARDNTPAPVAPKAAAPVAKASSGIFGTAKAEALSAPPMAAPTMAPMASTATSTAAPAVAPLAIAAAASQGDLEGLREENLRLKNALERERREYEERFMRESSSSSQVSEVMEKIKLLEKENSDLKYQLADARSMVKPGAVSKDSGEAVQCAAADPKVGAEVSVLREENARLKADLAAQKTALVQLEMQAKAGDGKAGSAEGGMVSRLQSRIDELAAQNTKLQSELLSAKAAATAAVGADGSISVSQLRSVEAQLQLVEKERDTLRAQIEKMGENQENGLLKLSGSDWNLEQATRRYNEAEREIRRLGSQLEQSRSQCAAEKKEIEYMLFDPEIATQQQISTLMKLESEVNITKDALAKKDQEVNARINEYEQKITKLEADTNKSKAAEAELEALRAELTVAKQSAAEQLAVAQKRVQEAEAKAQAELAVAQKRAEEAERLANEQVAASQQRAVEAQRLAEAKAQAELVAAQKRAEEAQRLANEQIAASQQSAVEAQRLAEAKAQAELVAAQKRAEEAQRLANEQVAASQQRAVEAQRQAEAKAQAELVAAQKRAEEAQRLANEQVAASQQRAAEAQRLAEAQAQAKIEEEQKRIAEAKRLADEQVAVLQGRLQQEKAAVASDMGAQLAKLNAEKDLMAQRVAALEADKQKMQNAEGERMALKERVAALEAQKSQLEARIASAVQPAAGTPRAAVQEMAVASVQAVAPSTASQGIAPQPVHAEPVSAPSSMRPGQISARVEPPAAPIALAPKSAIASDSFQPTQAVVAPVVQQAVVQQQVPPAVAAQPVVMAAVAASSNLITADALSGQLRAAGLPVNGPVKKLDNVSNTQSVAYSWDAQGLFGSAEQKQMANAEQFMTLVQQYLDKTKSRCVGDFAASPVPTLSAPAGMQVASYEIACISADGTGATAALAFYGKNGLFTTVAHESGMDTMDMAMDARDRLLASVIK